MAHSPQPLVDRGGQAERTRLSWNRTALALAANAALIVRLDEGLVYLLPAIGMLAAALACFLYGARRYRIIVRHIVNREPVSSLAAMRGMTLLCVIPMAIALGAILL